MASWQCVTVSRGGTHAQVGLKKYASVSPRAFGLAGRKRLAVIRAAGAIVGGSGSP